MKFIFHLIGCENKYRRVDAYPFRRTCFAWPYLLACAALALGEALGFACGAYSAFWPLALFSLVLLSLVGYGWELPHWPHLALFFLGLTLALFSESRRTLVFNQCDYSSAPFSADFKINGNLICSSNYTSFDSSVHGVPVRVIIRNPSCHSTPTSCNNPSAASSCCRALVVPQPASSCCRALVVSPCSNMLADPRTADGGGEASCPAIGEIWRCTGWLERKPRDERDRRTLWVSGRGTSAVRVAPSSISPINGFLSRLRSRLSAAAGIGLSHDPLAADLDRAIVLGERANLPRSTRRMFADAGTIHVFAISGLHVGVIAWMIVYFLMSLFFFPLRFVVLPLIPILGGYVLMIGAPPSAVRAAVMSVIYFAAPMFFRRPDSLVSWAITFLVFHILLPNSLYNVGSLLSFTVMLGILLYLRWAETFKSEKLAAYGVSPAAWAAGVGIAAHVFSRITPGGLLANIALIPLASFCVIFGALGAVTGLFSDFLASHFNNAAALLIQAMSAISWAVTQLPYANLEVAPWGFWSCAAWYSVLILTLYLIRSVYIHNKEYI